MPNFKDIVSRLTLPFSKVGSAARKFRKSRADYYEYLANMLTDSDGRMVMSKFFRSDSVRYLDHPRGILSQHWAERYAHNGANLVDAWRGTMPEADLMLIAAAVQHGGTDALPSTFREVARITRVMNEAKSTFIKIVLTGAASLIAMIAAILLVPFFIWPQLERTFDFVPAEFYGDKALGMASFAENVPTFFVPAICITIAILYAYKWSLPNWHGSLRCWFDKHTIFYRINRDFRGAVFLSTLASIISSKSGHSINLRQGVNALAEDADPWLNWYCQKILARISSGITNADVFDVGLLDKEIVYYLVDIAEARSLNDGLTQAGLKTEKDIIKSIRLRAQIVQFVLLISSLLVVGSISGWTMAVINDLSESVKLVYQ